MSVHSSLRSLGTGAAGGTRSVLKRHERVRWLIDQGKWDEQRSMFGLPKIKQVRIKARKAAAKEKTDAQAAASAEGATAAAPAAEAKAAKSSKSAS